jgi:hypothetical protein
LADQFEVVAAGSDAGGLGLAGEFAVELVEPFGAVEAAERDLEVIEEVVQVPAQLALVVAAGPDEPVAVVEQQSDLLGLFVEFGARQVVEALLQRGADDGERVDRVGLAAGWEAAAGAGGELGRDTQDALAVSDEEALEPAGDVAAVFDRPDTLGAEPAAPGERSFEPGGRCLDGLAAELLARRGLDRRHHMRGLVRVRSDRNH